MKRARGDNLAKGGGSKFKEKLRKLYESVLKGFEHQQPRSNDISDFWKMYNCQLGSDQLYNGRNQLYAPFVRQAIDARATRFVNQLFPQSDRHVEASTEDGTIPRAGVSLCEKYVAETKMRQVVRALCVRGDVEGQMNLYCDWFVSNRRTSTNLVKRDVDVEGLSLGETDDVEEEEDAQGGPRLEVIPDPDVSIQPVTSSSPDDAISSGGHVCVLRRWTKRQVKQLADNGTLDKAEADKLTKNIESYKDESNRVRDADKDIYYAAGIKKDGRGPYALVYEIWTELEIDDEYRLCQVFMVGPDVCLMARRNPLWCDRVPLISAPVDRIDGSVKGISQVIPAQSLQRYANDIINQMADSTNLTVLPIMFRDPAYATSPIVLMPGAIIDVPPGQIDFAKFPAIWQEGMVTLQELKAEIFQVLSVNPAMVTQGTKKKMNQAEVSQEQQIDLLTTSDSTRVLKDEILTPLMNLFMDLDYQFRKESVTLREYGEMGVKADLDRVPPFASRKSTMYYWIGDEIVKSTQQVQQKIGFLNVLRQLPPDALPHYQMNIEPIIVDAVETIFGARIARYILQDTKELLSMDPNQENQLMQIGQHVDVHPTDNPFEHIPAHEQDLKQTGDPFGLKTAHIADHKVAYQRQMQMRMMQGAQPPGQPGGGQQGPGARPGAMPAQGRPAQQPPGAIHQDQMSRSDPTAMPRKM